MRSTPLARALRGIGVGIGIGGACLAAAAAGGAASCTARSHATTPPRVVELYTSEGCSSCPPADRWLSTLKGRSDVIALGYHVTYWDRLGWPDRFASEQFTRRQYEWAARQGRGNVYTPQVLVDGLDWRAWPRLPDTSAPAAPAPVLTLTREPDGKVLARVEPQPANSSQLGGYWAVVEHDHASRVRAGENSGETLRHDHVVRLHRAVPAFAAREGLVSRLDVLPGAASNPRRIVFVVTRPPTEVPLQALALDC
ncbi:MAG: DUF1223 domain-containing protein [Rubrivivax sp.]|nr:DUF1223 domain-containing protein [Rubrivivax sp.]